MQTIYNTVSRIAVRCLSPDKGERFRTAVLVLVLVLQTVRAPRPFPSERLDVVFLFLFVLRLGSGVRSRLGRGALDVT